MKTSMVIKNPLHFSLQLIRCLRVTALVTLTTWSPPATAAVLITSSVRDTTIASIASTANFGAADNMSVGYAASAPQKSLVGFNVATITGDFVVNSITLRLYYKTSTWNNAPFSLNNNIYQISAANSDWVEGTGGGGR